MKIKQRLNIVVVLISFTLTVHGQSVPSKINYQGRLMNGTNLVNGTVGLKLSLYDSSTAGTLFCVDSNTVTVMDGTYSTFIGDNVTSGNLRQALLQSNVFIEVSVDGTTLTPREQLVSVGYAILPGVRGVGNAESGTWANVSGGSSNLALGGYSFIGGGSDNIISNGTDYAAIAGGRRNIIQAGATNALIVGGFSNVIVRNAAFSIIVGGARNIIQTNSDYCFIGGGSEHVMRTNTDYSVIVGGFKNVITNGAKYGVIVGGSNNMIDVGADYSVVFGGANNAAEEDYSFAGGRRAKAEHQGSFVWGDSSNEDIVSTNNNSWTVRCIGGARFVTAIDSSGDPTAGVYLNTGGGSWASLSDRNVKDHVIPVDQHDVLEKVAALPISTWNMKTQDPSIRHMGPMAQDFHHAFGLGENPRYITSTDIDGVSLAAIQALYQLIQQQQQEIERLKAKLETRNSEL